MKQFDYFSLAASIKEWGISLGFSEINISDINLSSAEINLQDWLNSGFNGEMKYFNLHEDKRTKPNKLVPGTVSVITARLDYLPNETSKNWREIELKKLSKSDTAVISLYARGRDYHKVFRKRLEKLAKRIMKEIGPFGYRVFCDSAPVMEVELAVKSGLGWRGKHTLLLNKDSGSMFFLGEIYTNLPLPKDYPVNSHCGECKACIDICPTKAIIAPYKLDARRCISYLTIELKGSIPIEFRSLIGNRILGCDDCQLVCPWNKFAKKSKIKDFDIKNDLDNSALSNLFLWEESEFNYKMSGSSIKRVGYEGWLRNIAVAIGNALKKNKNNFLLLNVLNSRLNYPSKVVREHILWAKSQSGN